jgi:hypothetical protein
MFYPKPEGKLLPFAAMEDENGQPLNLLNFDRAKHIVVKADETAETVTGFPGQNGTPMPMPSIPQMPIMPQGNTAVADLQLP